MTDNEIIKALEICSHRNGDLPCEGCPAYSIAQMCMEDLMSDALDLIKRQKAEIEQWKEEANRWQNAWCEAVDDIQIAKSEAIKEFAERVKAYLHTDDFGTPDERWRPESEFAIGIDNLVKEMTEENGNDRA